jgi:hypothetical protein
VDPGVASRPASTWTEPLLLASGGLSFFRNRSVDASVRTATWGTGQRGGQRAGGGAKSGGAKSADPAPSAELVRSIQMSDKWKAMRQNGKTLKKMNAEGKMTTLAQAALETLKAMTSKRNVVFAASNPYDARYLHRAFGREPVPWPGTSPQLAKIRYTGTRKEIIFCCGNAPYNSAILHAATTIVNASKRLTPPSHTEPPLVFGWASELYSPSWVCKKKAAAASKPKPSVAPAATAADASAADATAAANAVHGRRLEGGIESKLSARRQGLIGNTARTPSPWKPAWTMAMAAPANSADALLSAASTNAGEKPPLTPSAGSTAAAEAGEGSTGAQGSACGYKYTDLASHPLAVLLPYSVHSYGVVQAYAMGVPLLAPSPRLLATWHTRFGFVNHKGPGNAPWRRNTERKRVPNDGYAWLTHDMRQWYSPPPDLINPDPKGCSTDPNDACDADASERWLRFSEPYTWPHVTTFDSTDEVIPLARALLNNATRRREISDGMKAFFKAEGERAMGHARSALHRALKAARLAQAQGGS